MTQVFGAEYAKVYDAFYRDKDYAGECDLIEALLNSLARPRRILDLGCGTGEHARRLADRGYDVVGVDRSADMIARAQEKQTPSPNPPRPQYHVGDLRAVRLDRTFDAVLMMFAVLGYQSTDDDVRAALRTARAHLASGGLLLTDFWYAPAVLAQKPSTRAREVQLAEKRILRTATPQLIAGTNLCRVDITWKHDQSTPQRSEPHVVRYFFPDELERFLTSTGFRQLRLGAWPDIERPADEFTWNAFLLAQAGE